MRASRGRSLDRDRLDAVADLDAIGHVLAARDEAEVRVQLVEVHALAGAQEELRIIRDVDVIAARHPDRALHERQIAELCAFLSTTLADQVRVRIARAREGIATLGDEVRDDPVERESVVEARVRLEREDRHGLRSLVRAQLDDDRPARLERDRGLARGLVGRPGADGALCRIPRCRERRLDRRDGPPRRRRRGYAAPTGGGDDGDGCERGEQPHPTVIFLILSPMRMPFTTSWPLVTWPKFVYWSFSHDASVLQTNHWASLLTLMSGPLAIPAAPFVNGRSFSSLGILPPPRPVPSGSPPCTTQSSTRWKVLPS